MASAAISEHGIIGNMRSAALVSVFGEIDFFCFPEFDSPSVFASLLDTERAGCFSLCPAGDPGEGEQMYLPETNILLTRFLSEDSVLEVLDFMPVGDSPNRHCIVRKVTAVEGASDVNLLCRPAFDYARATHQVEPCPGGLVFDAKSDHLCAMRLEGSIPLQSREGSAVAQFHLAKGECASFVFGSAEDFPLVEDLHLYVEEAVRQTSDFWARWAAKMQYKGRWQEMVQRSALVLKLLISSKHGSILAAPTFGLPEAVGGSRNWDYRYVWLRDASFTVYAFGRLGYYEEGRAFERWLEGRVHLDGDQGPLNVMYRADGSDDLKELQLEHLAGYRGSKPVLIGNDASGQLQLDIYGELFDATYLSSKYGDGVPFQGWQSMKAVLHWLEEHWQDPDEGIWEVRGGRREFLHSRLMCWVAFDRAIRLGDKRSLAGPFDWMERCRDAIVSDIHENFWNAELGAFVQYKGSSEVDASTLLMPLMRFISVSDPRWLSTLSVIERELVNDTLVRRYSSESNVDGLTGREGGFIACAFWLVEAKARSHQVKEARELFEKLLRHANPLGLYAEEMKLTGEHLGNFPQALSHLAFISAATYLDRCLKTAHSDVWN